MAKKEPLATFIEQCTWTWIIFRYFKALFATSKDNLRLLKKFAPVFFADLGVVLHEYFLLRMCLLTDKPDTTINGNKVENLSVGNLIATLPLAADVRQSLEQKAARLYAITKPIRKARNRIIAHVQKENALWNNRLGQFKAGEDEEFFDILEDVVNTMHDAVKGGPYSIKVAAADGPVSDMIVNLRLLLQGKETIEPLS